MGREREAMRKQRFDIEVLIDECQRIASTIFPKILEENKRLGIATPIGIAGRIYFIMPDGKILTEEEYKKLNLPEGSIDTYKS